LFAGEGGVQNGSGVGRGGDAETGGAVGGEDCAGGVVLGLKWYSRWGEVERG